jgi:hypothetical protein
VSDDVAADPAPEVVPGRMRRALLHVADDFMPEEWVAGLGRWLFEHRLEFVRGGDETGWQRFNWELCELERYAPNFVLPFRQRLIAELDKAQAACSVPAFDLRYVEVTATLHHHGGHFTWHDDVPGYTGEVVPSRRISFAYYLHAEPKMFSGGELEFLDGTLVEPKNNRVAMFHPVQQHRVRPVECWSAHVLHGRWALIGWVHGDPPPGWVERLPALRGIPPSG